MGRKQLRTGVEAGYSLTNQAGYILKQLEQIEEALFTFANPSSVEGLEAVSKLFNTTVEEIYSLWVMNVCALLILKKIKNDENNGILTTYRNGKTLVVNK